jgi:uncharacterized membrane protein
MIQLPIVGAFLEAAGMIIEKKILGKRDVNFKNYTAFSFLAILVVMLPFLYFVWELKPEAFEPLNIFIFFFVVVASVFANFLVFYSLKRENITEFEPIWLMQPFFTIILAFMIFPAERNWEIVALALVASLALILSHVKKHHLNFDRYVIAALVGGFLFSLEMVVSRMILDYYSGFSLYFLRCFFIFIISFAIYRPSFKPMRKGKTLAMVLIVSLMWVLYRAIIYYGYVSLGIVFTTMLFILSPVLMFFFAIIFLKEKPTKAQIISTVIILVCVALAVTVDWK